MEFLSELYDSYTAGLFTNHKTKTSKVKKKENAGLSSYK